MQGKVLITDAKTTVLHSNLALKELIGNMFDLIKGNVFDEWFVHGMYWL